MAITQPDLLTALNLLTQPEGTPQLDALSSAHLKNLKRLRRWPARPGIVGSGIEERISAGVRQPDDLALKVYVEKRLTDASLSSSEYVPTGVTLPTVPVEVPIDFEEIETPWLQALAGRVRPAAPGYSVGLVNEETGTLGCLVYLSEGSITLRNNSHVLALSGQAAKESVITQPGHDDGGAAPNDNVVSLTDWVSFDFDPGFNNFCDAAAARRPQWLGANTGAFPNRRVRLAASSNVGASG